MRIALDPHAAAPEHTRVDVVLISGSGVSNPLHRRLIDTALQGLALAPGQPHRAVCHVERDSIHVVRGGVLLGKFGDQMVESVVLNRAVSARLLLDAPSNTEALLVANIPEKTLRNLLIMDRTKALHLLYPLQPRNAVVQPNMLYEIRNRRALVLQPKGKAGDIGSLDFFETPFDVPSPSALKIATTTAHLFRTQACRRFSCRCRALCACLSPRAIQLTCSPSVRTAARRAESSMITRRWRASCSRTH